MGLRGDGLLDESIDAPQLRKTPIVKRQNKNKARFHCRFQLPGGVDAFGDLRIRGQDTFLHLTSDSELPNLRGETVLTGSTLDGRKITCIDCVRLSQSIPSSGQALTHHDAEVFPNFVVIGDDHLDPTAPVLRNIQFDITDISSLFYDFDAFGFVLNPGPVIDSVLAERREMRPVESGEWPQVAYFTGKFTVTDVDTEIGKVSVCHRLSQNWGGPDGVFIRNRMFALLEPESPVTFHEALDRMLVLVRFLSVIAGRQQGLSGINVGTMSYRGETAWRPLEVTWSHAPKGQESNDKLMRPNPGDIPLDPIHRPDEFAIVLKDWISREKGWRVPRTRYVNGISKGSLYDADRLVAAANMFDILPADAFPNPPALSEELAKAQAECLAILRRLQPENDRDRAIGDLTRIGKPSLPKRVQHRVGIVEKQFGKRCPELAFVLKIAVKYRNYLVHGGADDFDIEAAEPFIMFLTDALEFVFAASDLIDAGWDATRWSNEAHGTGHTFARFRFNYLEELAGLKLAIA